MKPFSEGEPGSLYEGTLGANNPEAKSWESLTKPQPPKCHVFSPRK